MNEEYSVNLGANQQRDPSPRPPTMEDESKPGQVENENTASLHEIPNEPLPGIREYNFKPLEQLIETRWWAIVARIETIDGNPVVVATKTIFVLALEQDVRRLLEEHLEEGWICVDYISYFAFDFLTQVPLAPECPVFIP